jgi:hypothetical protein
MATTWPTIRKRPTRKREESPKGAPVRDSAQQPAEDTTRAGDIKYPADVWDGTDYAEFARRGTKGNFIPPEFFIESLKTYVGAIAGNNMRITNERSGNPRFYTILLAGPGTGKNTAIDCTRKLFRVHDSSLIAGASHQEALIWNPQDKTENSKYNRIGALPDENVLGFRTRAQPTATGEG